MGLRVRVRGDKQRRAWEQGQAREAAHQRDELAEVEGAAVVEV